jgi:RNA polymerase sigma-70 factor (ECF subfamily)
VLAYALSLVSDEATAEDLVQDAFVTAFSKFERFDPTRDFGAWVRGIVRNKYLEWIRGRRETPVDDDILDVLDLRHESWDRAVDDGQEDLLTALAACMRELPELFLQVVQLFYFEQCSCRIIAATVNAGEVTVRKRLHLGRKALGQCIRKALQHYE